MLERLIINKLMRKSTPHLAVGQCIRARLKGSDCQLCQLNCPVKAIAFPEGMVDIKINQCLECGRCCAACPTGALSQENMDSYRLVAMVREQAPAVLYCNFVRNTEGNCCVPCLGSLDADTLISLALASRQGIVLNATACSNCREIDALAAIQGKVQHANRFLASLPGSRSIELAFAPEQVKQALQANTFSRKEMFSLLNKQVRNSLAELALGQEPRQHIQLWYDKHVPPARVVLLHLLSNLPIGPQVEWREPETIWGSWQETTKCNACGLCATLCPTGAMELARKTESILLVHHAGRCTRCQMCQKVCPNEALAAVGTIQYGDVCGRGKVLQEMADEVCPECGTKFVDSTGQGICSQCLKKKDLEASFWQLFNGLGT